MDHDQASTTAREFLKNSTVLLYLVLSSTGCFVELLLHFHRLKTCVVVFCRMMNFCSRKKGRRSYAEQLRCSTSGCFSLSQAQNMCSYLCRVTKYCLCTNNSTERLSAKGALPHHVLVDAMLNALFVVFTGKGEREGFGLKGKPVEVEARPVQPAPLGLGFIFHGHPDGLRRRCTRRPFFSNLYHCQSVTLVLPTGCTAILGYTHWLHSKTLVLPTGCTVKPWYYILAAQ